MRARRHSLTSLIQEAACSVKIRPDADETSTVVVPEKLRDFFLNSTHQGMGGFQSFSRDMQRRLTTSKTLALTTADVAKIARYCGKYGSGGYQSKCRELLSAWKQQNTRTLRHLPESLQNQILWAVEPPETSHFTRTHYDAIGKALRREIDAIGVEAVERIARGLAKIFTDDNSRFDELRWLETCGLEPHQKDSAASD
jgi:hypothetical protein